MPDNNISIRVQLGVKYTFSTTFKCPEAERGRRHGAPPERHYKIKFEILVWPWNSCSCSCVTVSSPSPLEHDITINVFHIIDLAQQNP